MYDVIVVGGGHAGIEACLATSRIGKKTLLVDVYKRQVLMPKLFLDIQDGRNLLVYVMDQ